MTKGRGMARLIQLALLGVLVTVAVTVTAAAAPARCTYGVSAVGPAVVINGELAHDQSDLTAHTTACVSRAPVERPAARR